MSPRGNHCQLPCSMQRISAPLRIQVARPASVHFLLARIANKISCNGTDCAHEAPFALVLLVHVTVGVAACLETRMWEVGLRSAAIFVAVVSELASDATTEGGQTPTHEAASVVIF